MLGLLGCVVWRGLPLGTLNSNLSAIVEQLCPTLLVDGRNLAPGGRRLLAASGGPRSYVTRAGSAVNFAVARAIYLGEEPDPDFHIDFAAHIRLAPSHGTPCMVDEKAREQMLSYFQPRLLDYRLRYREAVQGATFDLPQMQAENRVIAKTWGACIVDSAEIHAGIQPLLENREHQIHEARLTDLTAVVIEVLLASCHESKPKALQLKEVAAAAEVVLKCRGEAVELEPRAIGGILDDLGLPRKRNSRGYCIELTAAVRRQIHLLARDHDVESIRSRIVSCALCVEFLGGGTDVPPTDARSAVQESECTS